MVEVTQEPARIYLQPKCCAEDSYEGRQWCEDDVWECPNHGPAVAYVLEATAQAQAAAQEQRIAELEAEVERLRKGNSSIPLKRSHQITLQTHINLRTFARYPNVEEAIRAALGEQQ